MGFSTIAVLSPGNMGGAVGALLGQSGYDVIACLAGRSEFTRRKADEAGFRDVADLNALVSEADLILSILDPAKAMDIAGSRPGRRKAAAVISCTGIFRASNVASALASSSMSRGVSRVIQWSVCSRSRPIQTLGPLAGFTMAVSPIRYGEQLWRASHSKLN